MGVAPADVPKFVAALVRGKGEMVNGSRLVYPMEGRAMRFLNLLPNKSFAILFTWLLGQQVRDTLCGTKALWREDYERIMTMMFKKFPSTPMFGCTKLTLGADHRIIKQRDYYDLWGDIFNGIPWFHRPYRKFMHKYFG